MKPDDEQDNYGMGPCFTLQNLADYYSGQFGSEDYSGEANDEVHVHII